MKNNYFYKVGVIQNSAGIYQIISLMSVNFYGSLNSLSEQSMNYNLAASNQILNNMWSRRPEWKFVWPFTVMFLQIFPK